jgi:thioredoxin-dependent peroxiredoxin
MPRKHAGRGQEPLATGQAITDRSLPTSRDRLKGDTTFVASSKAGAMGRPRAAGSGAQTSTHPLRPTTRIPAGRRGAISASSSGAPARRDPDGTDASRRAACRNHTGSKEAGGRGVPREPVGEGRRRPGSSSAALALRLRPSLVRLRWLCAPALLGWVFALAPATTSADATKPAPAAKAPAAGAAETRSPEHGPLAPGAFAPDFTLPDQAGRPVELKRLLARGRVLLYFYPKDFTPGCTQEAHAFAAKQASFDSVKVEIVGVSVDQPASHARFAASCGVSFPMLADSVGAVAKLYGVDFDLLQAGRVRVIARRMSFLLGRDGKVEQTWTQVTPRVHPDEVLAWLRAQRSP